MRNITTQASSQKCEQTPSPTWHHWLAVRSHLEERCFRDQSGILHPAPLMKHVTLIQITSFFIRLQWHFRVILISVCLKLTLLYIPPYKIMNYGKAEVIPCSSFCPPPCFIEHRCWIFVAYDEHYCSCWCHLNNMYIAKHVLVYLK